MTFEAGSSDEPAAIKVSGKDIAREGVEAIVFIHLDGWLWNTEPLGSKTRDKLLRNIIDNVWKSFLIAGHKVKNCTLCMVITAYDIKRCSEWRVPVDHVFETFHKSTAFKAWCEALVPDRRPIIVATVTNHCNYAYFALEELKDRTILAIHRLEYANVSQFSSMAEHIYSRDPEGTIAVMNLIDDPPPPARILAGKPAWRFP